jgi:hypothetical protein
MLVCVVLDRGHLVWLRAGRDILRGASDDLGARGGSGVTGRDRLATRLVPDHGVTTTGPPDL